MHNGKEIRSISVNLQIIYILALGPFLTGEKINLEITISIELLALIKLFNHK